MSENMSPGRVAFEAYMRHVGQAVDGSTPTWDGMTGPRRAGWEAAALAVKGTDERGYATPRWQPTTPEDYPASFSSGEQDPSAPTPAVPLPDDAERPGGVSFEVQPDRDERPRTDG